MSKVALITGANAMDSKTLARFLQWKDYKIVLTYRRNSLFDQESWFKEVQIDPLNLNKISFEVCDITDQSSVRACLENTCRRFGLIHEIYLIAAMSHVGMSFTQREYSILANGQSYYFFLEWLKQNSRTTRVYGALCYDENTRVLTPDGIKSYTDCKVGDMVFSLNPETQKIELQPIDSVHVFDYEGDMVHFKGLGKDLMVTPDHTVFYKTRSGKILSKKAKDIREMSVFEFPSGKWFKDSDFSEYTDLTSFIPEKTHNRSQIEKIKTSDLYYLIGLYLGDGSCNIMSSKYKRKSTWKERQDMKNELGQYTSVSSWQIEDATSSTARITIDIPKDDECYQKVIDCLNRNGIKWVHHGQCDITFFSWGIYHFLDKCGHTAHNKHIPQEYKNAPAHLLEKLLEGLMDSDGDSKRNSISTVSEKLSQDICELAIKIGKFVKLSKVKWSKKPYYIDGRLIKPTGDGYYTVKIHRHSVKYQSKINTAWHKKDQKAPYVPYKGKVWCFHLKKNHNFLVERNGYFCFSGNTSELAGNVPDDSFFDEKSIWNPKSPYSLGKQLGGGWIKLYRESLDSQLFACFGILFNHSNYFRTKDFYIAKVCHAAASITHGETDSLKLGNLNFFRDEHFSDFGVEMMHAMLQLDEPEDFVIGTGKTWHGEQYLDAAFKYFNLDWRKYVKIDNGLKRPNEVNRLISDSSKAQRKLGWNPNRMSFDEHIAELCAYWDLKITSGYFRLPNIHEKYPNNVKKE